LMTKSSYSVSRGAAKMRRMSNDCECSQRRRFTCRQQRRLPMEIASEEFSSLQQVLRNPPGAECFPHSRAGRQEIRYRCAKEGV
jgi:hypothetical protein